MLKRKTTWITLILLFLLLIAVFVSRGPEAPTRNPSGTFAFAVLGDAPYYPWEDLQFKLVLGALEANDLNFIIDVGDIFWHPCSDDLYLKTLGRFNQLRHPVVYTPGDNEWTDCWETGSGNYAPLDRLNRIRQIFFADPSNSLGRNHLSLISQSTNESFSEFVENARWIQSGIVFATVNIVGSNNAMRKFPARTAADDVSSKVRTEAAAQWVRDAFDQARALNASAVVISFHANASLEQPDEPDRHFFDPFILSIEEETEKFARPVLLAHGDGHIYTVDHPLVRRTTGRTLENLTRLQVPGSPQVGWVKVIVTPGTDNPFAFENHVVPRWKYW